VMLADHGRLLGNAVRWAINEEPVVTVAGPGLLDVTVWRQSGAIVVHLVNFTNPMMMKGPMRELTPIGEQRVRLRVEGRVTRTKLLVSGRNVHTKVSGKYLEITIPSILDHEVLALDIASN